MTKLRIELLDVSCGNTEDVTGADEFYVVGAFISDDPANHAGVATTAVDINDGQTRGFRPAEALIFNDELESGQDVALVLQAYDEDVSHDWSKRPDWIDVVAKKIGTIAGAAAATALVSNPAGWGTIATAVGAGLALGGFYWVMGQEKDDQLGAFNEILPVDGDDQEIRYWRFSHGGWYSGWDYTVRYRISREGQGAAGVLGRGWQALPGCATDIGVARDGAVWVIGTNPVPGGYGIFHWSPGVGKWVVLMAGGFGSRSIQTGGRVW